MKKLMLGIFLTCLFLSGCGSAHKNSIINAPSELIVPISETPSSFDPRRVTFSRDLALAQHLFVGLYKEEQDGTCTPKLVEQVEISEDKKTYTLHLKKTYWSDNTPLTAYDVRDSWLQVLSPDFPSPYANLFDIIENAKEAKQGLVSLSEVGIKTLSKYCLVVKLNDPTSYFFKFLRFPASFPVHKSQRNAGSLPVKRLVSNGAFTLKKWTPEVSILLEKNPFYIDEKIVGIQHINLKIIKNAATAMLMFKKGELDWIGYPWHDSISPEAFKDLKASAKLHSSPIPGTHWLACNVTTPFLESPKIRQALSMSVDRKEIVNQVTFGLRDPASRILPPSLALGNISNPAATNLEKGKSLFNEALNEHGLTKKDFSQLSLSYIASSFSSKIAELIYKQWAENLGIRVKLDPCEFKYYLNKREKGLFDFVLCNWLDDIGDPLPFLEVFKSHKTCNGKENTHFSRWKNPQYDALLRQAIISFDQEQRSKYLIEAEECLMKDLPLLPLYHTAIDYTLSDRLQNITFFYNGLVDFTSATINSIH